LQDDKANIARRSFQTEFFAPAECVRDKPLTRSLTREDMAILLRKIDLRN
jgi:hypothetical protein